MTSWLSKTLSEQYNISVLSLHKDNAVYTEMLSPQIQYTTIQMDGKPGSVLSNIMKVRKFLTENHIDVVICVDTGMSMYGIPASWFGKTKVITWEHANFHNNWNSRWFPYIRRFAARHSDAMAVLTHRDKHNYETGIRRCAPVTVLPNPARRHGVAYDAESKVILSAGLLAKIKRFDLLVPIGKIVFAGHPDWKWVLCGDGPERDTLEAAVREAGLAENIIFCGAVKDMEPMYRSAAMYVLTSEMEGLPMVLLEAKSHGLPIVSFDIETGPSDIVRDGVNGYLVPSGDTGAMADMICRLIEDEALRRRFSANTALDMDKFDEERIVEQWEKLISSL